MISERIATMSDADWFDMQQRNSLGSVAANPGTQLAEVEQMKADRYGRAAAALRAINDRECDSHA